LQAEVQAVVDKSEAVSPDLIAALQSFSDKELAEKMAETMAPLAILGGKSVADVFAQLLAGTNLESVIRSKFLTPPKEKK
jgi:major vault protein